jgi:hypothetical protein
VSWVFIPPVVPGIFLRQGYLDKFPHAGFLLGCQLPLFSPQWFSWTSCCLMEVLGISCGCSESTGSLCTVGDRPSSTSKVVNCHSLEELGFSFWIRKKWVSCREVQGEALNFCLPWGTGLLELLEEQQVLAFLPSVENLAFFLYHGGTRTLLLSGTVGSAGPPCSVGREDSCCQQISKACVVTGSWHCVESS